jgi:hypothetical protein
MLVKVGTGVGGESVAAAAIGAAVGAVESAAAGVALGSGELVGAGWPPGWTERLQARAGKSSTTSNTIPVKRFMSFSKNRNTLFKMYKLFSLRGPHKMRIADRWGCLGQRGIGGLRLAAGAGREGAGQRWDEQQRQ